MPRWLSATEIHDDLLMTAGQVSEDLRDSIALNGPLDLIPDQQLSFPVRLCQTVTGQQLSVRAAGSIWSRLVAAVPSDIDAIEYWAAADDDVLRGCGLSRAKVKAVRAIALANQSGEIDAENMANIPHAERTKCLTAIWGVGQWTADMMGLFYFGDPDIWPDGDSAARKMLVNFIGEGKSTIDTAQRFSPYRSYLALHMWRALDA